ncbi:MAG: tellurite resistance/C4-dicarboxylate transporter family protein [Actinomycetota bacterium]|nr:tellurite resistance/C4-dicarboxylate transporter family protein [Actinomycetota bacterium]
MGGFGRWARHQVAELHPGYAAWVMATGIVSTALALFGRRLLATIVLGVALGAFAVLLVAYTWRLVSYRRELVDDARDPSKAFGYFTLVAAANVVGVRFAIGHHPLPTMILGAISVPLWLLLTYAIPGYMMIGPRPGPVLPGVNGSWFMWVVATQSLAAAAATLALSTPALSASMAPLAVALWGIGVVLYLMLLGLITLHLLAAETTPHALSPTYWIYMGATAITVLAGARILALPDRLAVLVATRQVVSGLAFVLWAFGTWWVPMLIAFGVWRHLVRREPLSYEPTLWSMVFPLGMYAVGSASYGQATHLGFMVDIARVELWVAVAVWACVLVAMGRSLLPRRATPN